MFVVMPYGMCVFNCLTQERYFYKVYVPTGTYTYPTGRFLHVYGE